MRIDFVNDFPIDTLNSVAAAPGKLLKFLFDFRPAAKSLASLISPGPEDTEDFRAESAPFPQPVEAIREIGRIGFRRTLMRVARGIEISPRVLVGSHFGSREINDRVSLVAATQLRLHAFGILVSAVKVDIACLVILTVTLPITFYAVGASYDESMQAEKRSSREFMTSCIADLKSAALKYAEENARYTQSNARLAEENARYTQNNARLAKAITLIEEGLHSNEKLGNEALFFLLDFAREVQKLQSVKDGLAAETAVFQRTNQGLTNQLSLLNQEILRRSKELGGEVEGLRNVRDSLEVQTNQLRMAMETLLDNPEYAYIPQPLRARLNSA
ncbi:MAG: hypothetical protein A3F09_00415 [Chlamydiae bacterium RIFCSPHIGHO2_12_FULL_49_11]|nr:MAG: hypothetical protein A3F09_00415 [Chlamydiae bacterium RIFCSPHIGHO2_12_FULL_49_11]